MTLSRKAPLAKTPLKATKPLAQMSAKRRAQLAADGVPPVSTLARPREPKMAAPKAARRPTDTGPDRLTVDAVLERDGWSCVRCGRGCCGERGRDWSVQHRRARGAGGTSRTDANLPQNLILLCGSATTGCHGHVESNRAEAKSNGWAVNSNADPLTVPVRHGLYGWVLLTADARTVASRAGAA